MIKSILDIDVSCFADSFTPDNPRNVNLLKWLTAGWYKSKVENIRKIEDKENRDKEKVKLPAITPSGLFAYRSEKNLLKLSGFIQFDVDLKGNDSIKNYTELKAQLSNIKNIAYCGLSVSGLGYWGLMPIAYPEKHNEHFTAIEMALKHYGIKIDPAPKNIVSLRCCSYDPDGYFNHSAEVLKSVITRPKKPMIRRIRSYETSGNDTRAKVERYINEIVKRKKDIAPDYEMYRNIGFAFVHEFGEGGRDIFHTVCSPSEKYDFDKTERDYTSFLKSRGQGVTIGTFFHYCKQGGIELAR
jgi:hypothetical protein